MRFEALPDWEFKVEEVSMGVYKASGIDVDGRQVSCSGVDEEELIPRCREWAAEIDQQIGRTSPEAVTVFVPLIDEGTDCWRPAYAVKVGHGVYRLLQQPVPSEERWAFCPGEAVECDHHDFADGTSGLRAVRRVSP